MLLEEQQQMTQRQTWQQRLDWVLRDSDFEFPQIIMALPLLGWAVVLLLPGPLLSTSPAFRNLLFWPEPVWGALCGVLFAWYTLAGICGWRKRFAAASAAAAIWWLFVAASIILAVPRTTASVIYPIICMETAWVFLRYMARHDVLERKPGRE